jgi:hypothetical protein
MKIHRKTFPIDDHNFRTVRLSTASRTKDQPGKAGLFEGSWIGAEEGT